MKIRVLVYNGESTLQYWDEDYRYWMDIPMVTCDDDSYSQAHNKEDWEA